MSIPNRYQVLFEPVKIGPVVAPNRFYCVPHATGHSPLMPNGAIGIREMKARGGWGVVSMQLAEIDPTSDISNLPLEKLWDETDVRSHARMVERVKTHGAITAVELGHTGLRSRNLATGYPPLAPSSLPILKPAVPVHAKAMTKADIRAFRDSHRKAVRRAIQAGYDIVYVYVAHEASVLSHFLNPALNHRTDEYGGSLRNRLRLTREVLEETLDEVAGSVAIAIRFAVHNPSSGSALRCDGEGYAAVEMLADLPDLWDVNLSGWPRDSGTSKFDDEGFQDEFTAFVKTLTAKPVVGVGRYTTPDRMVSLVRRGHLDFIGAARPSIADPFLPNKIRDGRIDDIRECIGCNICAAHDAYSIPLRCTQNPTISEEWRRGWHPEQIPAAPKAMSVLVVGAGPAGLECALSLARAGHEVSIAEQGDQPGGRVRRESALPGLGAWRRVIDYRLYQLRQMNNVHLYLDSEVDLEMASDFGADRVVIATGASWRRDGVGATAYTGFDWLDRHEVLTPDDVMAGATPTGPVLVYDDDHYYMGSVIAEKLAMAGRDVSIVCPLPTLASWTNYTMEQSRYVARLHSLGVRMYPGCYLSDDNGALEIRRDDIGERVHRPEVGTLVMVTAQQPDTALAEALMNKLGSDKVKAIGDCVAPATIQAAVFAGHLAARELLGGEPADRIYRREAPVLQP